MATTLPTHSESPLMPRQRASIVEGSLWMIGVTLLLFFLPLLNGLIGGLIGGYKVGTIKRALLAAILPAAVVAAGLWIIFAVAEAPFWGLLAGLTGGALILLADVGIFIGAIIGAAASNR